MRCHTCDEGLECCHDTSIRHADGTTECLGDGPCGLAHELHGCTAGCDEVGCACGLDLTEHPELLIAA